jgi:hypothetical protein
VSFLEMMQDCSVLGISESGFEQRMPSQELDVDFICRVGVDLEDTLFSKWVL